MGVTMNAAEVHQLVNNDDVVITYGVLNPQVSVVWMIKPFKYSNCRFYFNDLLLKLEMAFFRKTILMAIEIHLHYTLFFL